MDYPRVRRSKRHRVVLVVCTSAAALWLATPSLLPRYFRTDCSRESFDVNEIARFAREHRGRESRLPTSLGGLERWLNGSGRGPVQFGRDPWGREYVYKIEEQHGSAVAIVGTFGTDGAPGGQGEDED